jgi:2'-5' RNA ligase
MHRLFVSLDLPKNIQHELDYEVSELQKSSWSEVKFIPRENWHFTLAFLGDQDDLALGKMINALETAVPKIKALEINIESLSYGPKAEKPSMIWALVDKESSLKLLEIKNIVNAALANEDIRFQEDKRTFNGHITLARLRSKNILPPLLKEIHIPFTAYTVSLIESDFKDGGAEYAALASWTLDEE